VVYNTYLLSIHTAFSVNLQRTFHHDIKEVAALIIVLQAPQ